VCVCVVQSRSDLLTVLNRSHRQWSLERSQKSHVIAEMTSRCHNHYYPTRMLMREWLLQQVDSGQVPGLEWYDDSKTLIKIPWIHASKAVWSRDHHSKLFENWAVYTGRPTRWVITVHICFKTASKGLVNRHTYVVTCTAGATKTWLGLGDNDYYSIRHIII